MGKSGRVGCRQLSSKRGNSQAGSDPWFEARSCPASLRRWPRWGSRRVGPQCSREGYREFRCGRPECGRWVQICSRCDRGNRYCGPRCARAARRESQRKSQLKYEQKLKAKLLRAARQKRYRARLALAAASRQPEPDEELPAVTERDPEDPAPSQGGSAADQEEEAQDAARWALAAAPRQPEPEEELPAVAERDPECPAPSQGGSAADQEETQDAAVTSDSVSSERVDPHSVTHQGSLGSAYVSQWRASRVASLGPGLFPVRCCFCGAWCRPERRRGPLRGRKRRRLPPFPGR